ncbi:IS66-like element accessory protein TnpA [Burkholderia pyrrocinia]
MSEPTEPSTSPRRTHRVYARAFKHQVVRETLAPGATVAGVARHHDLSANVVTEWRRLHRLGLLPAPVDEADAELLPVQVVDGMEDSSPSHTMAAERDLAAATCDLEIERGERRIRVTGLSMASVERLLHAWLA